MLVALLFLIAVKLFLLYNDEKSPVFNADILPFPKTQKIPDEYTSSPVAANFYIVREHWDFQHPKSSFDHIFYYPLKVFKRESEDVSFKDAECYYEERLKIICLRKMMFHPLEKAGFTVVLSYLKTVENSEVTETIIKTVNEKNLPVHEDFQGGLYKKK